MHFPNGRIIFFHKLKHAIMHHYKMLVMAFRITDVEGTITKIHIVHSQHPCFRGPYPTAIQKPEEYRNRNSPCPLFLRNCAGYAVAGIEKILKFHFRKCMWKISSWFFTGNHRSRDICFPSFLQILDKADNDIYPRPTGIILLRITFMAPAVCHLLRKPVGFRVLSQTCLLYTSPSPRDGL